jgi:hypothetical protein
MDLPNFELRPVHSKYKGFQYQNTTVEQLACPECTDIQTGQALKRGQSLVTFGFCKLSVTIQCHLLFYYVLEIS